VFGVLHQHPLIKSSSELKSDVQALLTPNFKAIIRKYFSSQHLCSLNVHAPACCTCRPGQRRRSQPRSGDPVLALALAKDGRVGELLSRQDLAIGGCSFWRFPLTWFHSVSFREVPVSRPWQGASVHEPMLNSCRSHSLLWDGVCHFPVLKNKRYSWSPLLCCSKLGGGRS